MQSNNITSTGYQMNVEQRSVDSQDLAARQSQLLLDSSLLDSQSLYAVQDSFGELDKLMKFDWLSHQLTIGRLPRSARASALAMCCGSYGRVAVDVGDGPVAAWRIVDPLIVLENGLNFDDRGAGGESLASLLETP